MTSTLKPTAQLALISRWLSLVSLDLMRVLGIAFFFCVVVATDPSAVAAVSEQDKKFITNLADRGPEQMLLGTLAEKQARTADVINFGKQMMSERTALDNDLRALAARKNVTVPKENSAAALTRNPRLGGLAYGAGYAGGGGLVTNYDKRWLLEMEKSIRGDLADCADEFQKGSDPDVKAWAEKTFERLKKHLLAVTDIRSKLK